MKKIFSFLTAILFAGSMMAEGILFEQTYPGDPSTKASSYSKFFTMTTGDYTLKYVNVNNGSSSDSWDAVRAGSKNGPSVASVFTTEAVAAKVSKVIINFTQVSASLTNNLRLEIAADTTFADSIAIAQTIAQGAVTFEIAEPAENLCYRIVIDQKKGSANGFNRFDCIRFMTPEGGSLPLPEFTPENGNFIGSVEVAIAAEEGAKIYYTLDETDPTVESTEYTAPFTLTATTLVKAFATNGEMASQIAEKQYTLLDTITVTEARTLIDSAANNTYVGAHLVKGVVAGKPYVTGSGGFKGNVIVWLTDIENKKDSLEGYYIAGKNNEPWESLDAALAEIGEGDTILMAVTKMMLYNSKIYETASNTAYYAGMLGKYVEDPTIVYDTLNVAEAKAICDTLGNNGTTETKYYIEGYAVYADPYDVVRKNQIFFMVDDPAAPDSLFEAYAATPMKDSVAYPVLNGDKVRVFGRMKKYIDTKNNDRVQLEVMDPTVEFLEEVEGDRTIVIPTIDTISVDSALIIGKALETDAVSENTYVIEGYISHIVDQYTEETGYQTFWMADTKGSRAKSNAEGAFEVYRGKPSTNAPIYRDAKVRITCKIKNYKGNTIENDGSNLTVEELEPGVPEEVKTVTVAEAVAIGKALASGTVSSDRYEITGYVSSIIDLYAEGVNETFWITDSKGSRASSSDEGAFEIYRGKPNTGVEIGLDGKVRIVANIKNYNGTIENDGSTIEVEVLEQGSLYADTLTVKQALAKIKAMEEGAMTDEYYIVKGYVAEVTSAWSSRYMNMTITMTDKFNKLTGDLGAFQIRISEKNSAKAVPGAYVYAYGHLQNHKNGPQVAKSGALALATAPKVDTVAITVAEAVEIAAGLEKGEEADIFYAVTGYVADIIETAEGTQSFWMTDSEEAEDGDLYIDMANIAAPAAQHQKVRVIGWVGKDTEGDARILQGDAEIVPEEEGIEQIVLTEKAQKVMVDGAIYIIRDNKLFNLQGAQVR